MSILDCQVALEGHLIPGICRNADEISEMMAQRGIDMALVNSARAALVDPLSGNRILKMALDQRPNLYGCLTVHLGRPTSSIEAVREMLGSRRFAAVLFVNHTPYEPILPVVADEILNACRRYQKPILLPTPNAACAEMAHQLAKTYSMHRFVFLGMGGSDWRVAVGAAHQTTNIYLEISGPTDLRKIPFALEQIGANRILFGSGMPGIDPAALLGMLEDVNLRPNDRKRILSENAEKLFSVGSYSELE